MKELYNSRITLIICDLSLGCIFMFDKLNC